MESTHPPEVEQEAPCLHLPEEELRLPNMRTLACGRVLQCHISIQSLVFGTRMLKLGLNIFLQ